MSNINLTASHMEIAALNNKLDKYWHYEVGYIVYELNNGTGVIKSKS